MRLLAAAVVMVAMLLTACTTSHDTESAATVTSSATSIIDQVTVPNVRSMQWADAKRTLLDAGFNVTEEVRLRDRITGVLHQDPPPGTVVAPGSNVTLVVAR